ncbi:MAG: AraC family transcriptional regulator [Nostoc sp.]
MTIKISPEAMNDLFNEVEATRHPDPGDALDVITQSPPFFAQGYWRNIQLRDGLKLSLGNIRMCDRFQTNHPEAKAGGIEYHFHFSGQHQERYHNVGAGQYGISGSGLSLKNTVNFSECQPFLEVVVWMRADVLRSFVGDADGQLPVALQHLIRPVEQELYSRVGTATPAMQTAARQILHCPRQGIAKRIYLEGKALELFGLMAEAEIALHDSKPPHALKSDTVDRIHYARDILLQRLEYPPTLAELAKLAGLNEYSLKQGFRQVFGKTVFGYLHDYSMEQAWQLLEAGVWKVEEVACMVGYRNLCAFSRAFRKQFGIRPKDCLGKNSV